jgi:hypothetical protein
MQISCQTLSLPANFPTSFNLPPFWNKGYQSLEASFQPKYKRLAKLLLQATLCCSHHFSCHFDLLWSSLCICKWRTGLHNGFFTRDPYTFLYWLPVSVYVWHGLSPGVEYLRFSERVCNPLRIHGPLTGQVSTLSSWGVHWIYFVFLYLQASAHTGTVTGAPFSF